jgi:hypothetical protein
MANSRKKQINNHEKALAKRLGGSTTPASGATDSKKGDIVVGEFLLDDKSTIKDSLTVTKDMLIKISREAREAGKSPALSLSFSNMGLTAKTWVCVPIDEFERLLGNV